MLALEIQAEGKTDKAAGHIALELSWKPEYAAAAETLEITVDPREMEIDHVPAGHARLSLLFFQSSYRRRGRAMRRAIPADVESGTPSLASDTLLSGLQNEVTKLGRLVVDQLERALRCYHTRDLTLAEEIIERDDAVDNLNLELEERCFALAATGGLSEDGLRTVRATVKIALNLERIGDAGTHIAKRVRLLVREGIAPGNFTFEPLETCALTAVSEVIDALVRRDLEQARRACLRESEFDTHYVACLTEARRQMQASPAEVPYLLHTLAVMKYLEKVADYVLNVGEQAIFLITGRRLKFSQYQQLGLLMPEAAGGDAGVPPVLGRDQRRRRGARRRPARHRAVQRGVAAQDSRGDREAQGVGAHPRGSHAARPRLGHGQGPAGAAARVR